MRKFFAAQTGVILILVYIQMYVQEGTYHVAFKAFGSFLVLISLTFAIALIGSVIRKRINRNINFADSVIQLSIYILPVYYIAQLVGWMYDKGIIGGSG
jgi:ABC-type polysaccharide/polyol phosphate export permease